jgi:hypothetical protein
VKSKVIGLAFLLLSGCAGKPVATTIPHPEIEPLEPETMIAVEPGKSYHPKERQNAKLAEKKVNEVFRSACFESFMVNRALIQTNKLSPQGVVDFIRAQRLTLPLRMYYRNNDVVGYRQPPYKTIHTNRKFHGKATICRIAANYAHEGSHVMGFGHDFNPTKRRPFSVPYSITRAFARCCA